MHAFHSAFAAALVALSGATATQAHAADREIDTISVDYSDLNLSTDAGVNALRHRLVVASRNVCGDSDARQLGSSADMQACRKAALQDALRDLRRVVASTSRQGTELAAVAQK